MARQDGPLQPTNSVAEARRYSRWRHRRQEANLTRNGTIRHNKDIDEIVAFAQMWEPYGGAPNEEILVRFGMSPSRFHEKLQQLLAQSHTGTGVTDSRS
ncbi:DUF3263 domain-containing protein [Rhodococcus sp. WS4]|nr:DUF3263 domain-containing protein [Rhodococcus sp. WS4]